MLNRLIPSLGFPWAIRCMGFITLGTALLSFPALLSGSSMLARPRKARKLFDKTALKDPLMLLFTASSFLNFIGYNIPYFYIPTYAREALGTSESLALYMLVMAVAASFVGRIASGFVAHYTGSIAAWCLCAAISGILVFSWISIETVNAFIAFSVLWGKFTLFHYYYLFRATPTPYTTLSCHREQSSRCFHTNAKIILTSHLRVPVCITSHTSGCMLRSHLPRPIAPRNPNGHVLERFQHRVAHRPTHSRPAHRQQERPRRFHRSADLERVFPDGDEFYVGGLVVCQCEAVGQGVEDMSVFAGI